MLLITVFQRSRFNTSSKSIDLPSLVFVHQSLLPLSHLYLDSTGSFGSSGIFISIEERYWPLLLNESALFLNVASHVLLNTESFGDAFIFV